MRDWGSTKGTQLTMYTLLAACRRQWWMVILGCLGIAALVFFGIHPKPVYYAQSKALFLAPVSLHNPNPLEVSSQSLISTAGIIQRDVSMDISRVRTTSPTLTLYDQGIYSGQVVRLPNYGGQYENNFSSPILDIEVTGSDGPAVLERMSVIQARVVKALTVRQDQSKVAAENRIRVEVTPLTPIVAEVGGSRTRLIGISALIGVLLTFLSVAAIDRARFRRGEPA
jgi:hypothetical protein